MNEEQCLDAINNGGETARSLLDAKMPTGARRFRVLDRSIRTLLADVKRHFPDATYYTASGGFHLMLGASHGAGVDHKAHRELIAMSGQASIGDGDF